MEAIMRYVPVSLGGTARTDIDTVFAWLLPPAVIAYLAFNNGGFDPLERSEAGIAISAILLIGTLIGVLVLSDLPGTARAGVTVVLLYTGWVVVSVTWTESDERTVVELARTLSYVATFLAALTLRARWRELILATALALGVLCAVAVLSRLHPSWFPESTTGQFFSQQVAARLAYPLNYSSALGALAAISLPLLLGATAVARTIVAQSLAAAVIPVAALALWLTASGLSVPAVILGTLAFLALAPDRLPKMATLLAAAAGAAVLFAAVVEREALDRGVASQLAERQGDEVLALTVLVAAGVGLVHAGIALASRYGTRPGWASISPRSGWIAVGAVAATALVAAFAAGLPSEAADAWDRFTATPEETPRHETRAAQILEYSSNGRYDFWRAGVDAAKDDPLTGIGPGTFEFWWSREGSFGFVRDGHSLYFETLAELGFVGLALILGFSAIAILGGAARALRSPPRLRTGLAAAAAAGIAFLAAAAVDWMWESAALATVFMLMAAVAVGGGASGRASSDATRSWRPVAARVALAAFAIAALGVNVVVYAGAQRLAESRSEAASGQLDEALDSARGAASVQPWAASPLLQQALVLEEAGELERAAELAADATANEPSNWRAWIVLSRLAGRLGNSRAAVDAFEEARALNPRSAVFQ